jgi:uncharacterized protein
MSNFSHPILFFIGLSLSNLFMTFAWYAHLRTMDGRPWLVAALLSWGIALFEYLIQVPANRLGYQYYTLEQLKIYQEVISLTVFIPFAVYFMKERISLNYLAAALCILAALWFITRGPFK